MFLDLVEFDNKSYRTLITPDGLKCRLVFFFTLQTSDQIYSRHPGKLRFERVSNGSE